MSSRGTALNEIDDEGMERIGAIISRLLNPEPFARGEETGFLLLYFGQTGEDGGGLISTEGDRSRVVSLLMAALTKLARDGYGLPGSPSRPN